MYVCACFNKSLHIFHIFPAKYKEMKTSVRLLKITALWIKCLPVKYKP